MILVLVVALFSPWWLAWYEELAARNQFVPVKVKEWARVSPFTSLEIIDGDFIVEFDDKKYEMVAIDDVPAARLYRIAELQFGETNAADRLIEDIAEVLLATGKDLNAKTVDLKLIDIQSNELETFEDAVMTRENREATMRSHRERLRKRAARPLE